jgi:secondary thiamine-phosphate synthase enzyme
MMTTTLAHVTRGSAFATYTEPIRVQTEECLQFIDLTDRIMDLVRKSRVRYGWVNVQTRHTTTAIVVNENEPLLLEDMKRVLDRLAPHDEDYLHNDFEVRTVNMSSEEDKNGHSHCKAMLLGTSETLNIVDGVVQLGAWQRIFLVEMDRAKTRTVSVMIMGQGA